MGFKSRAAATEAMQYEANRLRGQAAQVSGTVAEAELRTQASFYARIAYEIGEGMHGELLDPNSTEGT